MNMNGETNKDKDDFKSSFNPIVSRSPAGFARTLLLERGLLRGEENRQLREFTFSNRESQIALLNIHLDAG